MRHWKTWIGLSVLLVTLAACSTPQVAPVATSAQATPTAVPATATAVPASPTPAELPTEAAAVDYCVDCHIDKDLLIQTARPEEEKPDESEGAG